MNSHTVQETNRGLNRRKLLQSLAGGAAALAATQVARAQDTSDAESDPTPGIEEVNIQAGGALPPPTERDNNSYWQEIERRLGTRINFTFTPNTDYSAKIAAIFASGDLPDFLPWTYAQPTVQRAIADGAFFAIEDLGLPGDLRDYPGLNSIPEFVWNNAGYNGRYVALPTPGQRYQQATFLRQDWLTALGMEEPATTADMKALFEAFANQDPDGNGSDDTVAFSLAEGREGWKVFTEPFGVPNSWSVDDSGNLTHADISQNMKAAIAYFKEVYDTGVLNEDFPALTFADRSTEFVSGLSGGFNTNLASGYDLQGAQLRDVVPTAEVTPITPPVAEGYDRVTHNRSGINTFTFMHYKYGDDPELAWQALRILDFWLDPATEDFVNFGFEGEHHTVQEDGSLVQTEKGTADIQWIRAWGPRHYLEFVDAPYVTPEHKEQIKLDTARLAEFAQDDPTWGVYPDLGTQNPTVELSDFATDTFERMVRGDQDIETFDQFVEEWLSRGGQSLTDSMTTQYKAAKGL